MSKIKLPNGESYEVSKEEKDYVHVYVTHRNGQELAKPYVQRYNQTVAKSILNGSTVSGKVIHDPKNAFKDADFEAPKSANSKQGSAPQTLKDFSDDELMKEAKSRGLIDATEEYDELTVEELKAELTKRELPVSGNKDELIKRLTENDNGNETT